MKQLTCEMCGGTDLVKDGGVFVCQSCGTKYSVEEAKKMMLEIDGPVEIVGTVKIDNSENITNYLKMARDFYKSYNNSQCEIYCNKILEIDPHNYEAWFYKGVAVGWQSSLSNIRIVETINCFENALKYSIDENKENLKKEIAIANYELQKSIMQLSCNHYQGFPSDDTAHTVMNNFALAKKSILKFNEEEVTKFCDEISKMINHASHASEKMNYNSIKYPNGDDMLRYNDLMLLDISMLDFAIQIAVNDKNNIKLCCLVIKVILGKQGDLTWYEYNNNTHSYDSYSMRTDNDYCKALEEKKKKYDDIICSIDPTYKQDNVDNVDDVTENIISNNVTTTKNGGCYVATCVYGSYDCPQVWTLRRYRDYTLASTWYGRAFIRTYYAISPTIVKWFGDTKWFKNMWKGKLDRMVDNLQSNGVEDTPYKDKNWR